MTEEDPYKTILKLEEENKDLRIQNVELKVYVKTKCQTCKVIRSIKYQKRRAFLKELDKANNLGLTHKSYNKIKKVKCDYEILGKERDKENPICSFYQIHITDTNCIKCKVNNKHFPPRMN